MTKYRDRCARLLVGLPPDQRKIWEDLAPKKQKGFFYDGQFLLLFVIIGVVGAFVIAWFVGEQFISAAIAGLLALTISLAIAGYSGFQQPTLELPIPGGGATSTITPQSPLPPTTTVVFGTPLTVIIESTPPGAPIPKVPR
jgi:drug/metabolite transporter (DMT)-like permease